MPAPRLSARLAGVLGALELRPDLRVLEVGGGNGLLAEALLNHLTDGFLLGVDRSTTATAASIRRNAGAVARGQAEFVTSPLADLPDDRWLSFDLVVAVRVNVFWTTAAGPELTLIRSVLATDGDLKLCWDSRDAGKVAEPAVQHLRVAGFAASARVVGSGDRATVVVSGRPLPKRAEAV